MKRAQAAGRATSLARDLGTGRHSILGAPFFRFFVFDDPSWDMRNFRFTASDGFDSDIDLTDTKLGALLNAVNPDLSRFQAIRISRRSTASTITRAS